MRYAGATSTVMIHDVSKTTHGKTEEVKSSAAQTEKLNKIIYQKMAKNCGHDKNYFMDLVYKKHHAEWYLTANEAKKHNLIQHIGIPSFNVNIGVTIEFGV